MDVTETHLQMAWAVSHLLRGLNWFIQLKDPEIDLKGSKVRCLSNSVTWFNLLLCLLSRSQARIFISAGR